ncbi:hypothetical protein [Leuconostoc carnosum]|uniref:hypothetical protein n=1 Tax=Leuconostoc carnosum TaxID=1252 RepID=UPI0002EE2C85|nr:hypothetical protein [Leuconostoc carnosum]
MNWFYRHLTVLNMIIAVIAFVGLVFAVITKDIVSILAQIAFFIAISFELYDEHKRKNK